jgi:hypothetical protein
MMDDNPAFAALMYFCMAVMGVWVVFRLLSLLVLAILGFMARYWLPILVLLVVTFLSWFFRPVLIEFVDRAFIKWHGLVAVLKLRGLSRMGTTRVRSRASRA